MMKKTRITRKQIEKALPKGYGIDKACGVWYFNGKDADGDTSNWEKTCTDICTLDQCTVEEWVEMFNNLSENVIR